MSQQEKWRTVRIRKELIPPLEEFVEKAKDHYGIPLFNSVSAAVSQAVKEFLDKHQGELKGQKKGRS